MLPAACDPDVRCPACRRLLARRRTDGALEIRQGQRLLALVRCGTVACGRCDGVSVEVESCGAHSGPGRPGGSDDLAAAAGDAARSTAGGRDVFSVTVQSRRPPHLTRTS